VSIKTIIPASSKLYIAGGVFVSSLNNPTIGFYDFTNRLTAGNRDNVAVALGMAMSPNYLYYFHQMNFSLSIDESAFLAAIKAGTNPELKIKDSSNQSALFPRPFRLFRYYENAALDSFHLNTNQNASMIADFQGLLAQTADLVGITDIYAQVSFSVYEITSQAFIKKYKAEANL
jgi:hypothetical protein